MKYLIAIDSDGTLRRSDGSISEYTKSVIKDVLSKGNIVVICTGRPRYHTLEIANQIGINNYLISSNGSEIYDNVNKKVIWASYIDYNACLGIYSYAKENEVRVAFVVDNLEYVTMFTRNVNQKLLDDNTDLSILKDGVKQIIVIGSETDKIKKFRDFINMEYELQIVETSKENEINFWFAVINNDASKGVALLKLSEYLNISKENTIAIGNDKNDISMLKVAGIGVVVNNANDEIKRYADKIIESNDNDGVALYLEKEIK